MSKPRYHWWGYVKNVVRAYPVLKQEYDDLHEQAITANTSGTGRSGGINRGTESIALRELPRPKQREYEAVRQTVLQTKQLRTGSDRLKLIDMVFWKRTHTLSGAALALNISYDTAIDYHGDFIMLVAFHKELITVDELKPAQKIALKSQKYVLE